MDSRPYNYVFSPLAEEDMADIFAYLDLSSHHAANRLIDEIQSAILNLCDFPFSRPLVLDDVLRKKGYRILGVKGFSIFYVLEGQTIVIRRILHGRRNFERLL